MLEMTTAGWGERRESEGREGEGYIHPSEMDVLMHLLHVKSSTT